MAQTPKLKRLDPDNWEDVRFATVLRNSNRKAFFTSRMIAWPDSQEWHRTQHDRDFFIIWIGKERAGTIAVQHLKECEFLQNLCITKEYRGRGLARWAICQLMLPNRFIIAQVKPSNTHVIKMYQSLGFWRVRP